MPSYQVIYEIDLEAENPLEAARIADDYMQGENRAFGPILRVVNSKTGEVDFVALYKEDRPE